MAEQGKLKRVPLDEYKKHAILLRKQIEQRGWNDELSEILKRRKKEAGMAGRSEIQTMFTFIDADEGRLLVGNQKLQTTPD